MNFHQTPSRLALRPLTLALALAFPALAAAQASVADEQAQDPKKIQTLEEVRVIDSAESAGYISKTTVGGKERLSAREVPQSVSVITSERVRDQNAATVTEALNMATGVTVISNDMHQSQFYSRGYGMNVTYDGVPGGNLSGQQQLDLAVYDRVEVMRGPSGLFTGSAGSNFGGTVNLARKRAKNAFSLEGSAGIGTWRNHQASVDVTGPLNAAGTLRGRAVLALTDKGWSIERAHTRKQVGYATLDWDATPQTTLSVAAAYQRDRLRAGMSGLPAWSTGELLNISRRTNVSPDWNRTGWTHRWYTADAEHRFANGWKLAAKLTRWERDQLYHDAFPSSGVNRATMTLNYVRRHGEIADTRHTADVFASGPFHLWGREHRALVGANLDRFNATTYGHKWLRPWDPVPNVPFGQPNSISDFGGPFESGSQSADRQHGLYGQLRLRAAEPLTIVLGGRWSTYKTRSRRIAPSKPTGWQEGGSKSRNHFTPYAAALYDINPVWTVYASYSTMFTPLSNERVDGSTLDPREGRQFEVGAKAALLDGRALFTASIYDMRDVNRAMEDPSHPGFYVNLGKVRSRGADLELTGRLAPGWEVQAGYTYQNSKYIVDKNNAGMRWEFWEPRHNLKLWGMRHFESGPLQGLSVGLGVSAFSKTASSASSPRRQGGYAVASLMARYRINSHWDVQLNANNLFDRTYYTRLGGLGTYNTYGDPRNFQLTLRAQF